ncbi:hypothetical protein BZA77DRAFT_281276 [Pyronema omphalodes]|nr:hypothetical protein BZA77DRAFT_281276 [Pyronema omphalodes]
MAFLLPLLLSLLPSLALCQSEAPLISPSLFIPTLTSSSLSSHASIFNTFALSSPSKDRSAGSPGHQQTLSYIISKLQSTDYYDIREQHFSVAESTGTAGLEIDGKSYGGFSMTHSPSGKVSGMVKMVVGNGCRPLDYRELDGMKGNIALFHAGGCEFGEQVATAGSAGATGVVIYGVKPTNEDQRRAVTLGLANRLEIGPYVPVVGVDGAYAAELISAAKENKIFNLDVQVDTRWIATKSIIAETKSGKYNSVVMIGAHTDTVPGSPGINDNVSGVGAVLEIALQLSNFRINNRVRFLFFSGRENGMVGSDLYASGLDIKARERIALYLDVDNLASKNYGYFVYDGSSEKIRVTPGSLQIQQIFEKYYQSVGIKSQPRIEPELRGDYKAFVMLNFPIGIIHSGGDFIKTEEQAKMWGGQAGEPFDKNHHQPGDDIDNIDLDVWFNHTKALGHGISTFARDVSGVPKLKERHYLPVRK